MDTIIEIGTALGLTEIGWYRHVYGNDPNPDSYGKWVKCKKEHSINELKWSNYSVRSSEGKLPFIINDKIQRIADPFAGFEMIETINEQLAPYHMKIVVTDPDSGGCTFVVISTENMSQDSIPKTFL